MARANTNTLLPLDTWATILGLDLWDFNQVGQGFGNARRGPQCQHVTYQYAWQKDFISREEIASKIAQAESMIASQLGYWPAPHYVIDEVVQYPQPYAKYVFGFGGTVRNEWKPIGLKWGKIIQAGVFNRTLIQANASVAYSDNDHDSIEETFSLSVNTTVTNPLEIALYYAASERMTNPLDESWRIRPINVTIAAGVATITGHKSLLVRPELQVMYNPDSLNVSDSDVFMRSVDIYRVFTDSDTTKNYQGVAIWDTQPPQSYNGGYSVLPLTIAPRDNDIGYMLATYGTPSAWPQDREPDRLQVNYVSGIPLQNGYVDGELAMIITYLAVSLLPTEQCGCERSNRIIDYWRKPLSQDDTARSYTIRDLDQNPFGAIPTRGNMYAWRRVKDLQQVKAVAL